MLHTAYVCIQIAVLLDAHMQVAPGYHSANQDPLHLKEEAAKIKYPVLIKAWHGGGGKGMRLVEHEDDFLDALDACKREAMKSFNNDQVLLEKFIVKPRHVEYQVFGDSFGNAVHLAERDCSVQRRHQKVHESRVVALPLLLAMELAVFSSHFFFCSCGRPPRALSCCAS